MPFNSISFIVFFALFVLAYYCVDSKSLKLFFSLIGSYLFYTFGSVFNLLCLLLITVTSGFTINLLGKYRNKTVLVAGIGLIIAILLTAKYSENIFPLFSINQSIDNRLFSFWGIPIGISFYSLQAISLLVDAYTNKYIFEFSWKKICLFLSFFPQALAGPIHRANELLPQFESEKKFDSKKFIVGFKIMLWGYFCKLIVADKISLIITPVLDAYYKQDGLSLSLASILYSLQIYFDFWGYSLIAIGAGKLLGYSIKSNFDKPYSARSFRDFWHRWHITLSKWMKDYIYMPLGGRNKKSVLNYRTSIFVTFFISAFWHGTTANFLLWGATHATLYLAEDGIRSKFSRYKDSRFSKFFTQIVWPVVFFVCVTITWLIFRTHDLHDLCAILSNIFDIGNWTANNLKSHYLTSVNVVYLTVALCGILFVNSKSFKYFTTRTSSTKRDIARDSFFLFACLVLIILFGDIGSQTFIYFDF